MLAGFADLNDAMGLGSTVSLCAAVQHRTIDVGVYGGSTIASFTSLAPLSSVSQLDLL